MRVWVSVNLHVRVSVRLSECQESVGGIGEILGGAGWDGTSQPGEGPVRRDPVVTGSRKGRVWEGRGGSRDLN